MDLYLCDSWTSERRQALFSAIPAMSDDQLRDHASTLSEGLTDQRPEVQEYYAALKLEQGIRELL